MHTIVRRFIKTGIVFLLIGLTLGVYMLIRRELTGSWPHPYLVSAHTHAVLVGFVMFMILGVALWLFPRPHRDDVRYRPALIEASYWLLLLGTSGRFVAEVTHVWLDMNFLRWLVIAGGISQAAGLGVFMWTMWSRIRPVDSHVREARGERF